MALASRNDYYNSPERSKELRKEKAQRKIAQREDVQAFELEKLATTGRLSKELQAEELAGKKELQSAADVGALKRLGVRGTQETSLAERGDVAALGRIEAKGGQAIALQSRASQGTLAAVRQRGASALGLQAGQQAFDRPEQVSRIATAGAQQRALGAGAALTGAKTASEKFGTAMDKLFLPKRLSLEETALKRAVNPKKKKSALDEEMLQSLITP